MYSVNYNSGRGRIEASDENLQPVPGPPVRYLAYSGTAFLRFSEDKWMRKVAKVTVSLPCELLEEVERRRQERGETRSEIIAGLLKRALRDEQEREDIDRYIQGYREQPQTEEELQENEAILRHATVWGPWE